ncbi:MAG: UDP-3-O-(3-hydroxymyristoyl)glucosamine N-acyltransferase [Paramuribaculum sp.]|nr:UDP-3-O-(3-hydroxymyristoyl)glucosamine N-acyltransferase [Paramuribaculum sp.]
MEFSANQIASLAGGFVEGNGDVIINSFAKIEEGHPGAISFLANPKYAHFIYDTKSSAVIVSKDFKPEKELSTTLIRVEDPYSTVAHLLEMVDKMINQPKKGIEQPCHISHTAKVADNVYIGAFAYIGDGVKIAEGCQIYPQAYIGDGVKIGKNTIVYAGVKIYKGCVVGENCILHSGVVIGADGFGFAPTENGYDKIPQLGNVVIEDDVEIGANTTIDRAMMGSTRIKKGVKLDNLIQIAHNCEVGERTVMAAQVGVAGSTKIGRNCMLGGQVGLAGHITVGDDAHVAAQSGTQKDIPAGARLFGSPAMDLIEYGRQTINIKRLPKLQAKVDLLEKQLKELADKLNNEK